MSGTPGALLRDIDHLPLERAMPPATHMTLLRERELVPTSGQILLG